MFSYQLTCIPCLKWNRNKMKQKPVLGPEKVASLVHYPSAIIRSMLLWNVQDVSSSSSSPSQRIWIDFTSRSLVHLFIVTTAIDDGDGFAAMFATACGGIVCEMMWDDRHGGWLKGFRPGGDTSFIGYFFNFLTSNFKQFILFQWKFEAYSRFCSYSPLI